MCEGRLEGPREGISAPRHPHRPQQPLYSQTPSRLPRSHQPHPHTQIPVSPSAPQIPPRAAVGPSPLPIAGRGDWGEGRLALGGRGDRGVSAHEGGLRAFNCLAGKNELETAAIITIPTARPGPTRPGQNRLQPFLEEEVQQPSRCFSDIPLPLAGPAPSESRLEPGPIRAAKVGQCYACAQAHCRLEALDVLWAAGPAAAQHAAESCRNCILRGGCKRAVPVQIRPGGTARLRVRVCRADDGCGQRRLRGKQTDDLLKEATETETALRVGAMKSDEDRQAVTEE
jgi:hypothetical protein